MNELEEEPQTYECPRCGYKQTFDEAYMDSGKYCSNCGKYCPNCGKELNIPLNLCCFERIT